jgi:bacterioferritin-associated ferredoxin
MLRVPSDADDRRTIVCPCHDATLFDLKSMVGRGYTHPETVKRATAVFMGSCQGKFCAPLVRSVMSELLGAPAEDAPRPTVRAPLNAVRLGSLVDADRVIRPEAEQY